MALTISFERKSISKMYLILFNLLFLHSQLVHSEELDLDLGHTWNHRRKLVTIFFNVSNSSLEDYRYYFFDLHSFASHDRPESFPRQRLLDTYNALHILGLHENDYIFCVSFIDEYGNVFKPRFACYEFTLGEKSIGSHHGGSTGYLAPLLVAVAFVIHVFIVVVHHIKTKNYVGNLFHRFIDVDPKASKALSHIRESLKQLDHHRISASVQRRLSRVSIDVDDTNGKNISKSSDENSVYVIPTRYRRMSSGVMQTIHEYNP